MHQDETQPPEGVQAWAKRGANREKLEIDSHKQGGVTEPRILHKQGAEQGGFTGLEESCGDVQGESVGEKNVRLSPRELQSGT